MSYRDIIKHGKIEPKRGKGGAGMHPKYTPEEFEQLVYGHIEECVEKRKIPAIMHFAMVINISREQLYKYYKVKDDYKEAYATLETACAGILEDYALNPQEGDNRHAGILAFGLKQYGWTDKQEIEHSEKVVDTGENEW